MPHYYVNIRFVNIEILFISGVCSHVVTGIGIIRLGVVEITREDLKWCNKVGLMNIYQGLNMPVFLIPK